MAKYSCAVCGYVHEGDAAPEKCPQCGAAREKFSLMDSGEVVWADGHVVGVAKGVDEEILQGLRENFAGECTEVGMYIAMSRQADREGYPEVAEAYKRIAWEEADLEYGEYLGGECTGCHVSGGAGAIPNIHGLDPNYLYSALRAYASGKRENDAMVSVSRRLDAEQMIAITAFFASQQEN